MIDVQRIDRVVHLRIDVPPVNVLDAAALRELAGCLREVAGDDGVAAVLLSGAGRCFSAGASVADHEAAKAPGMIEALADVCTTLESLPMVTVALVHGPCMGGGLEVAVYCDFVVADPSATFGVPEITLAFFPPFANVRLPKLIGRQNAAYLALTGEAIDVDAAKAMGLVQKVLERDAWGKMEARFNRLSLPVQRLAKEALVKGLDGDLATQKGLFIDRLYTIEDVKEGIASFAEKRRPEWKHR
ncbi:MAG: enoyl-CoA hydratase/isomerase family protein [Pseudomonadota bacterium]